MGERARPAVAVALLALLAAGAAAAFLLVDQGGRPDLVLRYRLDDLVTLVVAGVAVGLSSMVFQTVTGNRILTPGIMGLDPLYALVQLPVAGGIVLIGRGDVPAPVPFAAGLVATVLAATLLYRWLLGDGRRGLHLLVLTGVVLGLLFRSLAALTARLGDAGAVAGAARAFGGTEPDLLAVALLIVVPACLALWWMLATLDVMTLGRDAAISLGIDHRATLLRLLLLSTALAAVGTALGGPAMFLGLLSANIGFLATGSTRHGYSLPAAALVGTIALVGGRVVIERWLDLAGDTGTVINLVGGVVVIGMLLKGSAR